MVIVEQDLKEAYDEYLRRNPEFRDGKWSGILKDILKILREKQAVIKAASPRRSFVGQELDIYQYLRDTTRGRRA